jgi:hypothetical protein
MFDENSYFISVELLCSQDAYYYCCYFKIAFILFPRSCLSSRVRNNKTENEKKIIHKVLGT